MSFTFAGNKLGFRNRSDNYQDNSTRISVNANQEVNVNTADTYHIDLGAICTDDDDSSGDEWTKEKWLDYYADYQAGTWNITDIAYFTTVNRKTVYKYFRLIAEHRNDLFPKSRET
jgi:hypothetical protein